MGTISGDKETKQDLDDSGFEQNELQTKKMRHSDNEYRGKAQLLDLSDDVLLDIFKHCSPQDLKALGFTCVRLATLILDHTLWQTVDARNVLTGVKRMQWMLKHVLCQDTTHLMISGYAREASGCLGNILNGVWQENAPRTESPVHSEGSPNKSGPSIIVTPSTSGQSQEASDEITAENDRIVIMDINGYEPSGVSPDAESRPWLYPRMSISPSWLSVRGQPGVCEQHPMGDCPGPRFSFNTSQLVFLTETCTALQTLHLEHCNIDCSKVALHLFPRSLKRLSLLGTKCYNHPLDKSFLFKIQDYLILLEELDLSCCKWLEPSALLPLSKLPSLKKLYMRRCPKMTEFVAYASLATRYGFNKLEVIDLRESPVGDSEVSSFGWVRSLLELYASPAPVDVLEGYEAPRQASELSPWEEEEPEFFKMRPVDEPEDYDEYIPVCFETKQIVDYRIRKNGETSRPKKNNNDNDEGPPAKKNRPCYCMLDDDLEVSPNHQRYGYSESYNYGMTRGFGKIANFSISTHNDAYNRSNGPSTSSSRRDEDGVVSTRIWRAMAESQQDDKSAGEGSSSMKSNTEESKPSSSINSKILPNIIIVSTRPSGADSVVSNIVENIPGNSEEGSNSKNLSDDSKAGTSRSSGYGENSAGTSRNVIDDANLAGASSELNNSVNSTENAVENSKESSDSMNVNDVADKTDANKNNDVIIEIIPGSNNDLVHNSSINDKSLLEKSVNSSNEKSTDAEEADNAAGCSNADKDAGKSKDTNPDGASNNNNNNSPVKSVLFRRNQEPVVYNAARVNSDIKDEPGTSKNIPVSRADQDFYTGATVRIIPQIPTNTASLNIMPRNNILYVNIGRRLNTTYRLSLPSEVFNSSRNAVMSDCSLGRVDPTTVVTDSTVFRFGRSDNEPPVNYIQIGPNLPVQNGNLGNRPARSNLRVLSITGYRNITNRSLVHLVTAAPHLRLLDLSRTSLTHRGVETFRSIRPDCEVIWSEFSDSDWVHMEGYHI